MAITLGIISIILWLGTIIGYVMNNLVSKNKKLEQMLIERETLISGVQELVQTSDKLLKEIDKSKAFESDDQVGFFFKTLKEIQEQFNVYFKNG